MSESENADHPDEVNCCLLRRKIVIGILAIQPEDVCGVPDTELVNVLDFMTQTPEGKQVIAIQFCPWCGKPRRPNSETRITPPPFTELPGDEWKRGVSADDDDHA